MDEAVAGGLSVVSGYDKLAREYENAGRHADAMRAYLKAAQGVPGEITPLRNAWEQLWKLIL
jgi:hypothetical protein